MLTAPKLNNPHIQHIAQRSTVRTNQRPDNHLIRRDPQPDERATDRSREPESAEHGDQARHPQLTV